jgi:hypothetical protein
MTTRPWVAYAIAADSTRRELGAFEAPVGKACEIAIRKWPDEYRRGYVQLERVADHRIEIAPHDATQMKGLRA